MRLCVELRDCPLAKLLGKAFCGRPFGTQETSCSLHGRLYKHFRRTINMPILERRMGLKVVVPDTYEVVSDWAPSSAAVRRGPDLSTGPISRPTPAAFMMSESDILGALQEQDMEVVDTIELAPRVEPTPPSGRRTPGAAAIPQEQILTFELEVESHEAAAILLKQDGMLLWVFAHDEQPLPAPSTPTRRGITRGTARRVSFRVTVHAERVPPPIGARRGLVADLIFGAVRAVVLKFAARIVIGQAMAFLERKVSRGIVLMRGVDPAGWTIAADASALPQPPDRPARILLFVPGTFSSTVGTFGALGSSPWCRAFLQAAQSAYDAVIGFDHPTLSVDPLANATDLLDRLTSGAAWVHPPHIDVICHSRGGLVFRSLIEDLLPLSNWKAKFGTVIFVAVTNGGTHFAEPTNWYRLADIYTNLATVTCNLLAAFPQATAVALVFEEAMQGLAALVKHLSTCAISEGGVPGLAAMEPSGDFIRKLNETQPGQSDVASTNFCAITSEFTPRIFEGDHQPKELPIRLVQALADGFVDQLMGEANDLVVHTASMTEIDPHVPGFIKDTLIFGQTPEVHHLNYFTRPEVASALTRWLKLSRPAVGHAAPEVTRLVGPDLSHWGRREIYAGSDMPAVADTDILITSGAISVGDIRESILETVPSYVVIQRPDPRPEHRGVLHYAFGPEEIMIRTETRSYAERLEFALDLHEYDQSSPVAAGVDLQVGTSDVMGTPSKGRQVVLEAGEPIAVVPHVGDVPSNSELASIAARITRPADEADRLLVRRMMPTFVETAALRMPDPGRGGGAGVGRTRGAGVGTTRGGREPLEPSAGEVGEQRVTCQFCAAMNHDVVVKRVTTVEVIVSREDIETAISAATQKGTGKVDPTRQLIIQLIPKVNFENVGDDRGEFDVPAPGKPLQCYFDVRPTHQGEGEIWVIARQDQVPLLTLILKPSIVSSLGARTKRLAAKTVATMPTPLSQPLHQITIFEISNAEKTSFLYDLQCPALNLKNKFVSDPLKVDRIQFVDGLYRDIESYWISSNSDADNFYQQLRDRGAMIFEELFPEALQRILWENRGQISSIMVVSTEPFIPWEIVYLKEAGQGVSDHGIFLGQLGLVRWLHGNWPTENLRIANGRARYIIPDYPHPEWKLPQARQEIPFLRNRFAATPVQCRQAAVRQLLTQGDSMDLLHFAGHGAAEPGNIINARIALEGRIEGANFIPDYLDATTVKMRANFGSDHPIIVLNACQIGRLGYQLTGIGGFAKAFLERGAGAFVGSLWSVGDYPARIFTEGWYNALDSGCNLAEATILAREAARRGHDATWLAYAVYGHPHAKLSR